MPLARTQERWASSSEAGSSLLPRLWRGEHLFTSSSARARAQGGTPPARLLQNPNPFLGLLGVSLRERCEFTWLVTGDPAKPVTMLGVTRTGHERCELLSQCCWAGSPGVGSGTVRDSQSRHWEARGCWGLSSDWPRHRRPARGPLLGLLTWLLPGSGPLPPGQGCPSAHFQRRLWPYCSLTLFLLQKSFHLSSWFPSISLSPQTLLSYYFTRSFK